MGHKSKELVHYKDISRVTMGVFDTHAHLYDARFAEDDVSSDEVLLRASSSGVNKILVPSDNIQTSHQSIDYAIRNNGKSGVLIWAAVGVHPHEATTYTDEIDAELRELIRDRAKNRIAALGEIGLDYHYDYSPREIQREVFRRQLDIAYEEDIPFILHEREATKDCLDILVEYRDKGKLRSNPGVCHCCSMSVESCKILIDMGFYIGFDGPLTYKNNVNGALLLSNVPLDRIVVETDSPYLTPEPNRGRRNEPEFVPFVVETISKVLGYNTEETVRITTENALRLYELNGEDV